ncbi:MAG: hypothetical protein CSA22_02310 [Deltaproteobacteria bacterium]|nr:MAG: hypothetical protein CSA22_02310 [Deltaproteobacteria bacterium]
MTTARKTFQQAVLNMKTGVRIHRFASNLTEIMGKFAEKLQGHYTLILRKPVRENRTQGSVRGRSGNWPFYLDYFKKNSKPNK